MLPGWLGGMSDSLIVSGIDVVRERTADLTQDLQWGQRQCPAISVLQQRRKGFGRVGMGDGLLQRAPQPFDAVGFRITHRRVDQHELTTLLLQQLSQEQRTFWVCGCPAQSAQPSSPQRSVTRPEQPMFIEGCQAEWDELPRPDLPLTVGLDGGYVHSSQQRSRRDGWFEVVAGKCMPTDGPGKCFGFVQTYDANRNGV